VRALAPLSRIPRVNAATEAALRVTHAALPVIAISIRVAAPPTSGIRATITTLASGGTCIAS